MGLTIVDKFDDNFYQDYISSHILDLYNMYELSTYDLFKVSIIRSFLLAVPLIILYALSKMSFLLLIMGYLLIIILFRMLYHKSINKLKKDTDSKKDEFVTSNKMYDIKRLHDSCSNDIYLNSYTSDKFIFSVNNSIVSIDSKCVDIIPNSKFNTLVIEQFKILLY